MHLTVLSTGDYSDEDEQEDDELCDDEGSASSVALIEAEEDLEDLEEEDFEICEAETAARSFSLSSGQEVVICDNIFAQLKAGVELAGSLTYRENA